MQNTQDVGFIKALFDFKFQQFITMRVLSFFYVIGVVLICLVGVGFAVVSAIDGDYVYILLAPLGIFLYLIIFRLWFEFIANLYRIGDNTQKMIQNQLSA